MAHRQGTSATAVPLLCPAQFGAPDSAPDYACLTETNPHPVLICRAGDKLSYGNAAAERLTRTLGFETPAALLPADHLDIKHRCLAGHRPVRAAASAAGRRIIWSYHPAGTDTVHLYGVDLSDNPLNTVLEHLNFGVLLVDSELRVHYANPTPIPRPAPCSTTIHRCALSLSRGTICFDPTRQFSSPKSSGW